MTATVSTMQTQSNCCMTSAVAGTSAGLWAILDTAGLAVSILLTRIRLLDILQ